MRLSQSCSFIGRTIPLLILLCLSATQMRGDALDTLQWRNPYPTGNEFVGIAFGNGQFVAVESAGYVLTTADGVSWMNRGPSTVKSPKTAVYAGGKFVVVGEAGEIATSEDAIVWSARSSGTTQALASVTYGNGVFVAVGAGATLLSSPDGITWTSRATSLNPSYSFLGAAFASGRFVAINNGTDLYTSEDGEVWTKRTIPGILQQVAIVSSSDRFMVDAWSSAGEGTSFPRPWTSTNGLDWLRDTSFTMGNSKVFAGGVFFNSGVNIFGTNYAIATSPDALVWTPRSVPATDLVIRAVAYGNGIYFGVGGFYPGGIGAVVKSEDTVNWVVIRNTGDRSMTISSGTYGAGKYVLFGSGSIFTSTDGVTYQQFADSPSLHGGDARYVGGKFVRLGAGTISRSEDGTTYTRARSGTLKALRGIAYGAGRWVVVGDAGEVRTSEDLQVWEGRWSGTDYPLNAVTYAHGKFVAVGHLGIILASMDGLVWTPQLNDDLGTLKSIVYGNGKFLAFGESLVTSPDGITWTRHSFPAGINRVTFGGGSFIATGSSERTVLTSTDGISWEVNNTPTSGFVEFLNGTYFLFGANGNILQSTPVDAVVLSAANNAANGSFEVTISGVQIGATYRLLSCTNLATEIWSDVTTFIPSQPVTVITVPGGLGAPQCYYRAVTTP